MHTQKVHTLVIGSGAAGLCAAVRIAETSNTHLLLATEGLHKGTSINTGSDKQTYYKLSLCGKEQDSVYDLAQTLFSGGAMHGDIALVEAAYSVRAFMHLVNLGLPFPTDEYGQFAGYKTDHDPRQRATSIGPYTSRDMCLALQRRVKELNVPIRENWHCIKLLVDEHTCIGAMFQTPDGIKTVYAHHTVFAAGGPGDLYPQSVYPESQTCSIGLALEIGAEAHNLQESQFGLASTQFRWNVSGTYMQVIPRFVSANKDGSDERELFSTGFYSLIFLKGYQWPFDVKKIHGSSQIDLAVYRETEQGRRVFLDYRSNPAELDLTKLSPEVYQYLEKSDALLGTPIDRLEKMNPAAVQLYKEHGIDLHRDKLEIAVCAQHNNGGLAGTIWYESTNIKNLYPIGEINGSHGITRPGGSALNAGQVGAFRVSEKIQRAESSVEHCPVEKCFTENPDNIPEYSAALHIPLFVRQLENLSAAAEEARQLYLKTKHHRTLACFMYIDAMRFSAESGTGSRGSALVIENGNTLPENEEFRSKVLVSRWNAQTQCAEHRWDDCRPVPDKELWFEKVWTHPSFA